ncbi:MAG: O-antigen ligase family protein [Acidimicrobiales bacterium]
MTAAVAPGRTTPGLRRAPDGRPADRVLVGLLVLTAVEPEHTPFGSLTSVDGARWWFLVPVWIAVAVVGLVDGRGLRRAVRAPSRWLLAAAVWMMITSPMGLVPHLDLVTAAGFGAFVVAGAAIVDRGGWAHVRAALFPASAILLVASVAEELWRLGDDRWYGVFRDANALAFGCVVAAISGIDRWMRGGGGGLVLAIGSLPVLVLTDGRIAMVALGVAVLALVRPALPKAVVPIAFGGALILVILLVTDQSLGERAGRTVARSGDVTEITTVTGRTDIWRVVLDQVRDRPLSGVGAGSTPEVFVQAQSAGRLDWTVTHAHDLWLQLAMSGGVVAAALVALGALGYTVRAVARPVRDRDALMLALLVHGLTEDVVAEPRFTLLLAAAAIASTARIRPRRVAGVLDAGEHPPS